MAKENYTPEEKKTLKKMFWNSRLVFSSFNMVKMEGNAFALTMEPALDELYKDKKEKAEAMRRHDGFFNTHAVLFSLIAGITYALERQKKETGAVDDTTIENIKVALMGPTAGIGDAFFFNCLRVIAAGVAIGLCSQANSIRCREIRPCLSPAVIMSPIYPVPCSGENPAPHIGTPFVQFPYGTLGNPSEPLW